MTEAKPVIKGRADTEGSTKEFVW